MFKVHLKYTLSLGGTTAYWLSAHSRGSYVGHVVQK